VTAAQELATVLHRTEIVMIIPPKTPIPRIETVALECLKPNPRNARTHSKRQIKLIADSVKTFGFVNPILIDKDGMIIAGQAALHDGGSGSPHRASPRR
jgi:ParB-like nuclease domain